MVLTKAQAKSLDILEVARSLGMEMKRKSHREYYWAEHDSFKIDTVKNTWHWYSQNIFGDTINLVQQMRNVSYKEAMVFLETGSFPEAKPVEEERKPFNYTLAPYEQPFVEARTYLKEIRGLSDDTIDFFLEKGVLAQAKRKDKDGVIEDVLVFKYLDRNQQLVGASLQGLVPDQERHPGKGYLKQIMYQSESISGLNVSIGSPKRLIVAEAPIDLMSYYELYKGELNDVRLVAMEGLKEGVLSHYVLEILQERGELAMDERDYTKSSELTRTSRFLSVAAEISTLFQDHKYDDLITLAVDHDKAGTDFITKLREKKIPVIDARPPQREGQKKTDWNEILKQKKQLEQTEEIQSSSHFPDTSHLSPEDATWLKENWNNIGFSVEPRKQMVIDSDKTVTYEKPSNPLGDGREPKKQIQSTEKAPENSQEQMNDRTSGGTGSLQPKAEGSTSPVLETSTFEQTVTSHPTSSYPYLQFSTNYDKVQRRIANYHPITPADLRRLNQYAPSIQSTAFWYLNELAGSLAVADFIQNKDMAGLSRHLKEGIKEFLDSDKYKDYLTKMSQLNNYSNRNLRLILAQNPEARQVASFKQWKENFGRYVKKGEKALRIFKPMTKIKKDENNQPILDKNGKPETVTFFGLVPVFDVSQTEGKEMPKAAEVKEQLTDLDYANLYRALMAIAKENDVSVRFEEMENNKHGYYSVPENQIVLRSNEMNKAQIIKTFLHEMAHAELHHADNPQKENLTRSTAELQAESVAYVVSSYYGIDTSEYSFNYLSGWSADKETLADLEAQLDIVQQEAKSLMVRMDQALEQLRLSQEKQTKRSFEQKLEKFKDQSKQAVEDHKQELKADAQSKKEKGFSK